MLRRSGRVLFGRPGHIRRPLIFLFVIGLAASLASGSFLTLRNITALLTSPSFLVVASVGEAFVVMVGMIDLGVESLLAASGMFVAWLYVMNDVPGPVALMAQRSPAAHWWARRSESSSRAGAFRPSSPRSGRIGDCEAWRCCSMAATTSARTPSIRRASSASPGFPARSHGVPVLVLIALLVVLLGQGLMSLTPAGAWIMATGWDESAARAVGLRTGAVKLAVLALSGFAAAMAGIMITTWQELRLSADRSGLFARGNRCGHPGRNSVHWWARNHRRCRDWRAGDRRDQRRDRADRVAGAVRIHLRRLHPGLGGSPGAQRRRREISAVRLAPAAWADRLAMSGGPANADERLLGFLARHAQDGADREHPGLR